MATTARILYLSQRGEGHRERIERDDSFTLAWDMAESFSAREICFLGLADEWGDGASANVIEFVALAERGKKITSFERSIRLRNFVSFEPLSLGELREALPARYR